MKTYLYLIATVCFANLTFAQQGQVSIKQDLKLDKLLTVYKDAISKNEHYTIQVGYVSSNSKANQLKSLVHIDFPNLPAKVDFESPTYRVKVGRFDTKIEVERKFREVRKKYPKAMILEPKK